MLSWLHPVVLEKKKSVFNGEIVVVKSFGKVSIKVDGYEQSGPMVRDIWRKILNNYSSKNTLVLGFGVGSLAQGLPGKITGVEIDPVMVELGKKYFPSNAKMIVGDARKIPAGKFDLILVDLYQGKTYPEYFETIDFLKKLKAKKATVIFNRLRFDRSVNLSHFQEDLNSVFKNVEITKLEFNTFFRVK